MRINHNMPAINTHRQLGIAGNNGAKAMEKLSSGLRINRAGDDAAGLSISEKMRAQIRGLDQASKNAQDGISLIQTAEGALNETHAILQRMRELSDQSANGTNTEEDRAAMQAEVTELKSEIDRIGDTTEFNTMKLLNGSLKSAGGVSVGQNSTTGSIVAKQTAGKTLAAVANAADAQFVEETLTIDGAEIKVNWQNLSSDEKAVLKGATTDANSKQKAAELIQNKVNEAIDLSGKNIAHIKAYSDGTNLVMESGSKGSDSKITVGAVGVAKTMVGTTATAGTSIYNGTTVPTADKYLANINGVDMEVTPGAAYANNTAMTTVGKQMEKDLNAAISTSNKSAGATSSADPGFIEKVKVNVTKEGAFEIVSESGPVNLSNKTGKTGVTDLGLSQAQTQAGGNGGMTLQIGANKGQTMTFGIGDMRSASLGISGVDLGTQAGAANALDTMDSAIRKVSEQRSALGASQNRLEHTIKNLDTSSENLQTSEARIRDLDMAKEMMNLTKNNILQQASQSMLAQANQAPQSVLQLLG